MVEPHEDRPRYFCIIYAEPNRDTEVARIKDICGTLDMPYIVADIPFTREDTIFPPGRPDYIMIFVLGHVIYHRPTARTYVYTRSRQLLPLDEAFISPRRENYAIFASFCHGKKRVSPRDDIRNVIIPQVAPDRTIYEHVDINCELHNVGRATPFIDAIHRVFMTWKSISLTQMQQHINDLFKRMNTWFVPVASTSLTEEVIFRPQAKKSK
jgi:hypothetical protein